MTGTVYSVPPIPPDAEHTTWVATKVPDMVVWIAAGVAEMWGTKHWEQGKKNEYRNAGND